MSILFLLSCGEYEALEIEKKAKRSADSLYRVDLDSLRKVADTFCIQNYDSYFLSARDSIKKEQLLRTKELIKQ